MFIVNQWSRTGRRHQTSPPTGSPQPAQPTKPVPTNAPTRRYVPRYPEHPHFPLSAPPKATFHAARFCRPRCLEGSLRKATWFAANPTKKRWCSPSRALLSHGRTDNRPPPECFPAPVPEAHPTGALSQPPSRSAGRHRAKNSPTPGPDHTNEAPPIPEREQDRKQPAPPATESKRGKRHPLLLSMGAAVRPTGFGDQDHPPQSRWTNAGPSQTPPG